MELSIFDIFKIGVGPSSSHTLGPWRAALAFLSTLKGQEIATLDVKLFGSLAKTGRGHGTDIAVLMGLSGWDPVTVDISQMPYYIEKIKKNCQIVSPNNGSFPFDPSQNIHFHFEPLPFHPNGIQFEGELKNQTTFSQTYFSVGGGFIVQEGQAPELNEGFPVPFPIHSERELLHCLAQSGKKIWEVVYANELTWRNEAGIYHQIENIWKVMLESVYRGSHTGGELPGGLNVERRAENLSHQLLREKKVQTLEEWLDSVKGTPASFTNVGKWVSCFALAVNEENAAFGRIVTAPTNGAAGVVPAVLLYHICFGEDKEQNVMDVIKRFLLTAGQIGIFFKMGSTLSAAEGGCQAEIGVSSAMAAAGLTECCGGTPKQVLMAAEIAMEHHLGLTCDPIKGLVQIPCIERNSMGAMKAITASHIALSSDPEKARVSLDGIIKTMWETAKDMNHKYKETADGGLAIHIPVVHADC